MFHHPPPPFYRPMNPHPSYPPSHPGQSYFYYPTSGPMPNQSSVNLNFTRDFDRQAFTSIPSAAAAGTYPFYDSTNQRYDQQFRWRPPPFYRNFHQRFNPIPAFHFQDKSTFYYMSDPIYTDDRITIQLTKVHIGPNGDQQRVFVEQEFSNEYELNKFVRNLRHNFEKTFNNRATGGSGRRHSRNTSDEKTKKSGVFVVEEPDEEPKIYPQEESGKPLVDSIQFDDPNQGRQSSIVSSCSTIRAVPRRKNRGKFRRHNGQTDHSGKENFPNEQYPKKSSRLFPTPSYSRYYEPIPPRFAMKEKEFRMRTDFGVPHHQPWRYNQGYPNVAATAAPPPPPPPPPGRYRRPRPPMPPAPAPATVAENLHFHHDDEQKATRVERTRSECRTQRTNTHVYLDSGPKFQFVSTRAPFVPLLNKVSRPMTPMIYHPLSHQKPMQHRRRLFPSQRF